MLLKKILYNKIQQSYSIKILNSQMLRKWKNILKIRYGIESITESVADQEPVLWIVAGYANLPQLFWLAI